jgi:hypothetical protein
MIFFVFLYKTQRISGFLKTWRVHVECGDVCAKFLFHFLTFFKKKLVWEHMLPCAESNFWHTGAYAPGF